MNATTMRPHVGHYVLIVSATEGSFPCWVVEVDEETGLVFARETDCEDYPASPRVVELEEIDAVLPHPDGDDGDGELFGWMGDALNQA